MRKYNQGKNTLFPLLLGLFLLAACTMEATPLSSPVPTRAATLSSLEIANPAAAFCQQKGFHDEIRANADGSQSGVCIFTDGSTCDDWAYLRGVCGPGTKLPPPAPSQTQTPTLIQITPLGNENRVVDIARQALADRINASLSDVKLAKLESVTWGDSCLELADPTEACTLGDTPGFKITLIVGITAFVFHTDLTASNIRLESNSAGTH